MDLSPVEKALFGHSGRRGQYPKENIVTLEVKNIYELGKAVAGIRSPTAIITFNMTPIYL